MRIILPLAGKNDLFSAGKFEFPAPLIEIHGTPIIQMVVQRLLRDLTKVSVDLEIIFVVMEDDCSRFSLDRILRLVSEGLGTIIRLSRETQGSLCSILMAVNHFNDGRELIVVNADQIFDIDLSDVVFRFRQKAISAGVITFETIHPRWSYIRLNSDDEVVEASEKIVISKNGIAGFYYFSHGHIFFEKAKQSILDEVTTNGRYYIAPVLNQYILTGEKVDYYSIANEKFHSFYLPEKIDEYKVKLETKAMLESGRHEQSDRAFDCSDVTIVVPMAGQGKRFADAGYERPKPFIEVHGYPMIERVLRNLSITGARNVILARKEHVQAYPSLIEALVQSFRLTVIEVQDVTEGTACTVLQARQSIPADRPLLIANCDQLVDLDMSAMVRDCLDRGLDGSILVFEDRQRNPKWSFVQIDGQGLVTRVREKDPISDLATVGIYLFTKASLFFDCAIDMIARNDRINGEFYTCPVYNYAISQGAKIGIFGIAPEQMHGLGTPEDLAIYLEQTSISENN